MDTTTALIVVDMQAGSLAGIPDEAAAPLRENAKRLLDAFRAGGLPVVLATVTGTPSGRTAYGSGSRPMPAEWTAPAEGFAPAEGDIVVERATWSALADPAIIARLKDAGAGTVVLTGIATSFGIESTARAAYDAGFHVVVPADAVADRSAEAHGIRITGVFPALAHVTDTATVLSAFA